MDHIYFENSDSYPLEPNNTNYSPVNAWWFAECSLLAYCHPGFAKMAYKLAGFDGYKFLKGLGTECMIAWNSRAVIISFRGTELKSRSALHEIKTDLNAKPIAFDCGGKVHRGFNDGLNEIWHGPEGLRDVIDQLTSTSPKRPLWITGHSLGGALASLCFARIPQATGLYTYGAPRVGNAEFVSLFKERCAWRIENAGDPIPLIPPDIPAIKFNFSDLGLMKFMNRDGKVLNQRPIFVLDEHKTRYIEAKNLLDSKLGELKKQISLTPNGIESSRRVLKEIDTHTQETKSEWKIVIQELFNDFGLRADDHQPILYAIKTWNALIESSTTKFDA